MAEPNSNRCLQYAELSNDGRHYDHKLWLIPSAAYGVSALFYRVIFESISLPNVCFLLSILNSLVYSGFLFQFVKDRAYQLENQSDLNRCESETSGMIKVVRFAGQLKADPKDRWFIRWLKPYSAANWICYLMISLLVFDVGLSAYFFVLWLNGYGLIILVLIFASATVLSLKRVLALPPEEKNKIKTGFTSTIRWIYGTPLKISVDGRLPKEEVKLYKDRLLYVIEWYKQRKISESRWASEYICKEAFSLLPDLKERIQKVEDIEGSKMYNLLKAILDYYLRLHRQLKEEPWFRAEATADLEEIVRYLTRTNQ
jgi:hypothetical protein